MYCTLYKARLSCFDDRERQRHKNGWMPCKPSGALCPDQKIADKEDKEIKMDECHVSWRAFCVHIGESKIKKKKNLHCAQQIIGCADWRSKQNNVAEIFWPAYHNIHCPVKSQCFQTRVLLICCFVICCFESEHARWAWLKMSLQQFDKHILCTEQARKSSEDTHFTGYARFEKVWAR